MNRRHTFPLKTIVLTLFLIGSAALSASGANPEFLGRDLRQWSEEFNAGGRRGRTHAAWAIAQLAEQNAHDRATGRWLSELYVLADDEQASVRYWGVFGLGRFALALKKEHPGRDAAMKLLRAKLSDSAAAPRIAAADALVRLGDSKRAIPVLIVALNEPQDGARIQAVTALEKLLPLVRETASGEIEGALRRAVNDSNDYVRRIATRALKEFTVEPAPVDERQGFDTEPAWEGFRNRLLVGEKKITRQSFGYRSTNHARGSEPGEVGGVIQRSTTRARYAKPIPERTMNDKLSASGRFAVTNAGGSSGMLFGWFHEDSRGWRTPNSLAIRLDGNGGKYWVLFEYGTRNWRSGGAGTFEGRYQTTKTKPFLGDGTPHDWTLTYDPAANGGDGEVVLTLDGARHVLPVAPGHKADGAMFNRFGLWTQETPGKPMEVYFDDLVLDGSPLDLSRNPGWIGEGNEVEFEDRAVRPKHDFGYSQSAHAGGKPGEIGGLIWRDEAPAFYAQTAGPFTLEDEISASGKVVLKAAASDSGVYLGWFDAATKENKETPDHEKPLPNHLAIMIEGPSRAGHYFRPSYRNADGHGAALDDGPTILPDGKAHTWSLRYSPAGAGGNGQITVGFDGNLQTQDLAPGHRKRGATFDRFGLFNIQSGGGHVEIYLDDLLINRESVKR